LDSVANDSLTLLIVWAAITRDSDYIRNEGLKRAVHDPEHRKEITAGGMWPYLLQRASSGVFS
jgi:hypothetical protein